MRLSKFIPRVLAFIWMHNSECLVESYFQLRERSEKIYTEHVVNGIMRIDVSTQIYFKGQLDCLVSLCRAVT